MGQLLSDVWRESAWIVEGAKIENGVVLKDEKEVDASTGQPDWAEGVVPESKEEKMTLALESRLKWHAGELVRRDDQVRKEIEGEQKEQKKKITSDDIHEGWSASSVAAPKPSPLEDKPQIPKKVEKTETIEVLNPVSVMDQLCLL